MNFNDAAIVSAEGSDYRIHFWYMNRNDAVNTMKILIQMKRVDCHYFFLYRKISDIITYY